MGNETLKFEGTEEARLKVIDVSLAVYRHHWDAYLKGVAFYFAAVSIFVGLLFSNSCVDQADTAVSGIVAVASLTACVAHFFAYRWFTGFQADMENLFEPFGGSPLNFSMSGHIPKIFLGISLSIAVCGALGINWSQSHQGDGCENGSIEEHEG